MNITVPTQWASGESISDPDLRSIRLLREAGCTCELPLLGYRPDVGPRCRTCNAQARVYVEADYEFAARAAGWFINDRGLFANRMDGRTYYGATPKTECAWQTVCEFDNLESYREGKLE